MLLVFERKQILSPNNRPILIELSRVYRMITALSRSL
jgi:hypothetical protein